MAIDIAHAAMRVPSFPVHRRMHLGDLEAARRQSPLKMGWAALLTSIYSQISQDIPELRDIYVEKPFPYLYRHPHPVASITIQRKDDRSSERLVWGRLQNAQQQPLEKIQKEIAGFTTAPIDSFFRDGLAMERRPRLLRKLTWWILMQWSGRRRAKHLGTVSLSSLGGWGAMNAHYPLVTTTGLSMGPIQSNGSCEVILLCDHRVLDGALAAEVLSLLENRLQGEVLAALNRMNEKQDAA
ncbi:MAG: hypothetical protein ACK57P_09780 [Planctomycetota bacterium]